MLRSARTGCSSSSLLTEPEAWQECGINGSVPKVVRSGKDAEVQQFTDRRSFMPPKVVAAIINESIEILLYITYGVLAATCQSLNIAIVKKRTSPFGTDAL